MVCATQDLENYKKSAVAVAKKYFTINDIDDFYKKKDARPLIFCHFARGLTDKTYDEVCSTNVLLVTPAWPALPSTRENQDAACIVIACMLHNTCIVPAVRHAFLSLQVPTYQQLYKTLTEALLEYNETFAVMDLVLFEDAMK